MNESPKIILDKVLALAKKLSISQENIIMHVISFTDLQLAIYKNVDEPYCITIMRRMMYRIASIYSNKINATVIINGESIGQVASQTLVSMSVINSVTNMPVISPITNKLR